MTAPDAPAANPGEFPNDLATLRVAPPLHAEAPDDMPTIAVAKPVAAPMPEVAVMGANPDSSVPFVFGKQIAKGGMGAILEGEDCKLGRTIAVKVMLDPHASSEQARRFVQEAAVLGKLAHPNIVPVYDLGRDSEGALFYTMKLVKGRTLQQIIDDLRKEKKDALEHYTLDRLLTIFRKVCDALAFAHASNIIHRDLKPENVMVGEFGEVLVMDWGIAKVLGQSDHEMGRQGEAASTSVSLSSATAAQTLDGAVMGTPNYMSPEQAMGKVNELDERSDIFSLGGLLYAILTLRPPVEGKELKEVLERVSSASITPPTDFGITPNGGVRQPNGDVLEALEVKPLPHVPAGRVPPALSAVAMKALKLEKAMRYQDVAAFSADIEKFQGGFATSAENAGALKQLKLLMLRHKAVTVALVTLLVLSFGFVLKVMASEQRATATLNELRATAPTFAEQARALAAKEQFDEAIAKLDYAIKLRPEAAEFLVAKGDLLQCQLQLVPAARLYRAALRVQPGHARAEASAKLCEELLAAQPSTDGKHSRESLAKLHLAMQQQQRPAAELLPVARLLGEEKKLLLDYWLARLKDLPVSAENPLAKRLTVREDGRLALDLSGTKITDLSSLAGAPLAALNLNGSTELTNLAPLIGLPLVELQLDSSRVTDLSPLRDMHPLENLTVNDTQVADLAPLSALRLKRLGLRSCPVTSLTPIQKMPLEELSLRLTRVTDLSPLKGMPMKTLYLDMTPVRDFSPLAQMPLEKCFLGGTQITDLRVLRGRPLKELSLHSCSQARHYAVLTEIKTLEVLLLPDMFRKLPDEDLAAIASLRTHPKLSQIQADVTAGLFVATVQSKDLFWQEWDRFQTFLPALRKSGIKFSATKQPDGTYELVIDSEPLSDLSVLKNAPISRLMLTNCKVSDLTPLRTLPLKVLYLDDNPITDLSPLRGMPLQDLRLSGTAVSDLGALTGMPLKTLFLGNCRKVTDLAPLVMIPTLEELIVPEQARNLELLRKMPNLKQLDFSTLQGPDLTGSSEGSVGSTAADFWKKWDALPWMGALRAAGIPYYATEITEKTPAGAKRTGMWKVTISSKDFSDFSILQGAENIRDLNLTGSAVTDLQPLRGKKLTTLSLAKTEITDLSPLADCKELKDVTLPPNAKDIEFLRTAPKLERISFKETTINGILRPDKTVGEFWKDYDTQGWLKVLRTSGVAIKSADPLLDGTWALDLTGSPTIDLTLLKGAPISRLRLGKTAVSDLTPLRGMALTSLDLADTQVTDLMPLKGMPLQNLILFGCQQLTDLSPLAETKGLNALTLPPNVKNIEFLRAFPRLNRLGFKLSWTNFYPDKSAPEFWKSYDALPKSARE